MNDLFKDRERAFETDYFRKQDEKLIQKMRERASLSDVAKALRDKLKVDNAVLLQRFADLGIEQGTGAAVFAAPLVQVAWAEGKVTPAERKAVLTVAAARGIEPGSPTYAQLERWLDKRPPDELFDTALEAMKEGFALLTEEERDERIKYIVDAAHRVAEASGGGLLKLLGLASAVSPKEAEVLDTINRTLRAGV